ncbi:hypothetical protein FRC04_009718 [Tulasnella sp. 424]|nr:hypothetical protein FRC04_009718 [Tulasnella sp. 424]KAG8973171.1 hypothetical protein FRC05_009032 [Tulasnella sp. 425]
MATANQKREIPISEIGPLIGADVQAEKIFGAVKDDVLKKIWDLHQKDVVYNLNEVWKLENIDAYDLISYRVEEVPHGINYYGKIQMTKKEDCVHVRVFRAQEGKGPIKFHAIQTRPSWDGGAVFTLEDPLRRFEY